MREHHLRAGAGKAEILFTQEDFPLKAFTGIHDPIHVRVLILEEDIRMAIISVELTSLPAKAIQHLQEECRTVTGIAEESIFVSVTHTFSAPHIPPQIRNEQEQQLSDTMYDRICMALRTASRTAADTVGPAVLKYREVSCCLNVNRNVNTPKGWWIGRNEDAFSDHTVRILEFSRQNEDGPAFAYILNYDLQPSVMDQSVAETGGRLISGDLSGAAMRKLEEKGRTVAFFLPGCAGDQAPVLRAVQPKADGTVYDMHEDGFILAEQLGWYLADRVETARRSPEAGTSACHTDSKILIVSDTALLPEQEMKYPTKELRPQKQYSFDLTGQNIPVGITLICLGEVRILMTTPELNSGFGTKIRKILGGKLLIGTLVNGGVKYLPEAEDFARITYEAMNAKLGPGSDERFLQAISGLKERI